MSGKWDKYISLCQQVEAQREEIKVRVKIADAILIASRHDSRKCYDRLQEIENQ